MTAGRNFSHLFLALICSLQPIVTLSQTVTVNEKSADRQLNLQRVHNLADRVLSFENFDVRVRTLVTLADLLWNHEQDYARGLFSKAYEIIKTKSPTDEVPTSTLISLRGFLILNLAKHDNELAKKWAKDGWANGGTLANWENFNLAHEFARQGDYETAEEYSRQGLQGSLSGERRLLDVATFLVKLRTYDQKTADSLFVNVLSQMAVDPLVQTNDLLIIGNYLFTGGLILITPQTASKVFLTPIKVGSVSLVADISVDRDGLSMPIAKAYILKASEMLAKPSPNEIEQQRAAAAAYLLLRKAQVYAPEAVSRLTSIASRTGLDLSSQKDISTSNKTPLPDGSLDSILKELEGRSNNLEHDQLAAKLVRKFVSSKNFRNARKIAEVTRELTIRNRLVNLVSYFEAVDALETGDLDTAEKASRKLETPLQRSLLLLSLADSYLTRGDAKSGERSINEAVKVANTLRPDQAASLTLSAVEMLGRYDNFAAISLLKQATRLLNQIDSLPRTFLEIGLTENVRIGNVTTQFSLAVRTVKTGSVYGAVNSIARFDPQNTTLAILDIKNEGMLSLGIIAVSSALLRQGSDR